MIATLPNKQNEMNKTFKAAINKLRKAAFTLQKSIDKKREPRLENTYRRATMAANIQREADRLEKLQRVMIDIAEGIEKEEIQYLKGISTKVQVEKLVNEYNRLKYRAKVGTYDSITEEIINNSSLPMPRIYLSQLESILKDLERDFRIKDRTIKGAVDRVLIEIGLHMLLDGGNHMFNLYPVLEEMEIIIPIAISNHNAKWYAEKIKEEILEFKRMLSAGISNDEEFKGAMKELRFILSGAQKSPEQIKKELLHRKQNEVARMKIPGYFPTPKNIVKKMLEEAEISSEMKVLEPSAGAGHIAEEIKKVSNNLDVVEYSMTLRELLKEKGFNLAGQDFLEVKDSYDRIVMNPPFEKGQDIEHVMHAFSLLNPGGRVVSIMSEGPFSRSDKQAQAFREFLEESGGLSEKLPEGAFKVSDRSTSVNTRLVVIDK
ncbi:rRNA adenine N-6-methyltransferase family protein [Bacillus cereus]|uniref:rRNA adenine N-6-methyltransferase family protein n=1 Tax=Bacillus cereus TaxID=1396 RepID=UPI000B4AC045|nr:rRNA adenine N-6-methyltransferase family protein [Bacillus cereus]